MPNTTKNIISKFKAVHKFIGCASSFKQEAFRAFPNMDSTSRTDAHWQMRPLYLNAIRVSSWRLATYLDASFRFFWKIAQRNTPTDHLNLHSHWHHYMFSRHRLSQIQIQTQKIKHTHRHSHTDTLSWVDRHTHRFATLRGQSAVLKQVAFSVRGRRAAQSLSQHICLSKLP